MSVTARRVALLVRRTPRIAMAILRRPRDLSTTVHVAVLFALAEMSVRMRPLHWSARRFGVTLVPASADASSSPDPGSSADAVPRPLSAAERRGVRAVQRLSPRLYGSERGCLRRSLVLGHVLRARTPVLRIGVRRNAASGFAAHAWIEIDGQAIEHGNDEYLPFDFVS